MILARSSDSVRYCRHAKRIPFSYRRGAHRAFVVAPHGRNTATVDQRDCRHRLCLAQSAGADQEDGPSQAPAPNVQFVVKSGDATVKRFTTDSEGRFQVALPAGHYVILREDAGAAIGHWRFEAEVVADEMTKVTWTGDSGMR